MADQRRVFIVGAGLSSAAGHQMGPFAQAHRVGLPVFHRRSFNGKTYAVGCLQPDGEQALATVAQNAPTRDLQNTYAHLDRSVLMAIWAARQAYAEAMTILQPINKQHIGVNIASSRGATGLFEHYHETYLRHPARRVGVLASPTTTAGNLSSWVLHDLGLHGPAFGHSITCSSGLYAIGNALAWLKAGMATAFVAGAAEAPLTGFTVAQLDGLRILAPAPAPGPSAETHFPSRPFAAHGRSGMMLAEGAAMFVLVAAPGPPPGALAEVLGFGFAAEPVAHPVAITEAGSSLRVSMQMAVKNHPPPDLILAHAPGTTKGDAAELEAIAAVWPTETPSVYSNKWLVGHTLGAAGALSLAFALGLVGVRGAPRFPYDSRLMEPRLKTINQILINAVGFGGVAASVLIRKANG